MSKVFGNCRNLLTLKTKTLLTLAKYLLTMVPKTLLTMPRKTHLERQLQRAQALHEMDLRAGFGQVHLPYALARKYPAAERAWMWQYVFPARKRSVDPRTNHERRHHLSETALQKAVKAAVRAAGIKSPASCHTFRHYAESRTMPTNIFLTPPTNILTAAYSA